MKKDKTKIPKGFYCYSIKNGKIVRSEWQNAHQIGIPMSLLWDQVKECNINEEIEDERR